MIIACLNIAKRLHNKIVDIEEIMSKVNILGIVETDTSATIHPPNIQGVTTETHQNQNDIMRVRAYIQHEIKYERRIF